MMIDNSATDYTDFTEVKGKTIARMDVNFGAGVYKKALRIPAKGIEIDD